MLIVSGELVSIMRTRAKFIAMPIPHSPMIRHCHIIDKSAAGTFQRGIPFVYETGTNFAPAWLYDELLSWVPFKAVLAPQWVRLSRLLRSAPYLKLLCSRTERAGH